MNRDHIREFIIFRDEGVVGRKSESLYLLGDKELIAEQGFYD